MQLDIEVRAYCQRRQWATLRAEGRSWKAIAAELGVGVGTILRAAQQSESRVQKTSLKPAS